MKKEQRRKVRLGEVIRFQNGKKRPNEKGQYPVYGGNGILNYTDNYNYENINIIGRVGAYCGNVYFEPDKLWVSDNAIAAINLGNSDIQFDYYLLKHLRLNQKHIGTSQPLLTQEILNNISVNIPPLPTQRAIAATLSCLDDKIALNSRINANLEAQAQTIFKSWFVDFEPFKGGEFVDSELGRIPNGWRVGKLSEFVNIKYGKAHQALDDGIFPVYGSGGLMRYAKKSLYDKESVLIPRKGTLNNVMYVTEPFWTVDTMFYTEMKNPNSSIYIYLFIKRKNLVSMNAGTAVPSMTVEILNALDTVLPPKNILKDFSDTVSILYNKQKLNDKENRTLAAIRDALLPKLMSGEILL